MRSDERILKDLYYHRKPSILEGVDGNSKSAVREFINTYKLSKNLEKSIRDILNAIYFASNYSDRCDWYGGHISHGRLEIATDYKTIDRTDEDACYEKRDDIRKYLQKKGLKVVTSGIILYIMNLKEHGIMFSIRLDDYWSGISVYPFGKIIEGFPGDVVGLPIDKPNCEDKKSKKSKKEKDIDDSTSASGISTPVGHLHSDDVFMYESEDGDKSNNTENKKRDTSNLASIRVDKYGNKHLQCPKCKSEAINIHNNGTIFHCVDCGFEWPVWDADNDSLPDDKESDDLIFAHPKVEVPKETDNKKDKSKKQNKRDDKKNKDENDSNQKNNPTKDSSVEDVEVNMKDKEEKAEESRKVIEAFEYSIQEDYDKNIDSGLEDFCSEYEIKPNEYNKIKKVLVDIYKACNEFSPCDWKNPRLKAKELKEFQRGEGKKAVGRYELLFDAVFQDRKNPRDPEAKTPTIDIIDFLDYKCESKHRRPNSSKGGVGSRLIFDIEADLQVIVQQARDKTMYIGVEIFSELEDKDLPPKKSGKKSTGKKSIKA